MNIAEIIELEDEKFVELFPEPVRAPAFVNTAYIDVLTKQFESVREGFPIRTDFYEYLLNAAISAGTDVSSLACGIRCNPNVSDSLVLEQIGVTKELINGIAEHIYTHDLYGFNVKGEKTDQRLSSGDIRAMLVSGQLYLEEIDTRLLSMNTAILYLTNASEGHPERKDDELFLRKQYLDEGNMFYEGVLRKNPTKTEHGIIRSRTTFVASSEFVHHYAPKKAH